MNAVQYPKRNTMGSIIQFSIVAVSFIVTLVLFFIPSDGSYDYMVFLPIGHCLLCFICFDLFYMVEKRIGCLLIIAGYTIRNVITPLVICLSGYRVTLVLNPSQESILWASLVMLYESAAVFLFLNYYTKTHKYDGATYTQLEDNNNKGISLFSVASFGVTLIMIFALIEVPAIKDSYKSLWATEDSVMLQGFTTIKDYTAGSFERLLYAFFAMFFSVMQIIWSIKLIEWTKKLFGQRIISVLLSFGVIFLNTLWVSETNAYTIFVIVILGLNILRMYPQKKKFVMFTLVTGAVGILILMVTARMNAEGGNTDNYSKLASLLNAYFPGVANVSILHDLEVPSKVASFYFDCYGGMPLTSLIPPIMSGRSLLSYFQSAIGSDSQILPFAGQTFYYFGMLGPVIQIIVVRFVMNFEEKAKTAKNNVEYLAYTTGMVLLAAGCTMYDISILVAFTLKTIVPFILLAKCKKIRIKL